MRAQNVTFVVELLMAKNLYKEKSVNLKQGKEI